MEGALSRESCSRLTRGQRKRFWLSAGSGYRADGDATGGVRGFRRDPCTRSKTPRYGGAVTRRPVLSEKEQNRPHRSQSSRCAVKRASTRGPGHRKVARRVPARAVGSNSLGHIAARCRSVAAKAPRPRVERFASTRERVSVAEVGKKHLLGVRRGKSRDNPRRRQVARRGGPF
jgi:hypothetical protein